MLLCGLCLGVLLLLKVGDCHKIKSRDAWRRCASDQRLFINSAKMSIFYSFWQNHT